MVIELQAVLYLQLSASHAALKAAVMCVKEQFLRLSLTRSSRLPSQSPC